MRVAVPRESEPNETRVAATPESVAAMTKLGVEVAVEVGLGAGLHWSDGAYEKAGAQIISDRAKLLSSADVVLRVRKPPVDEIEHLREGCLQIGFLDPFNEADLIRRLAQAKVSAVSMEMVPRTTKAQKLDALSSQHSVAGYYMVLLAAERLGKVCPMMMTPSGAIQPARILIIGAGVAGLQAIATAKRMGARVEAFDTRPVVKEQVQSLGAKFVEIDLGDTGETAGGYAKELTEEQKAKQQEGLTSACSKADIVITTAALFGRPAPVVITDAMLRQMKPGSVIVDYAVATGGNVEGSRPDEEVELHGVRVIGVSNYAGRVAVDASRMYANNLSALITDLWDKESKHLRVDPEDEILGACLITHEGKIVNAMIRERLEGGAS